VVVHGNSGFPIIFLLKALFGDWTFMVKIQDLTFMVGPDDDGVYALLHSWRRCFWRMFRILGVVTTGGALAAAIL
jgi:hypothetical protein